MKVCLPAKTPDGFDAPVYGHFGSAPYFLIYDDERHSIEIVPNSNDHHEHGACNPISNLSGQKVNVVICGGMGARALQNLHNHGIRVFLSKESTVGAAIEKLNAQLLDEMSPAESCQGHGCH